MKRVLHVLNSLERSGMEMMLLNSGDEWEWRGFHCDVLATAKEIGPLADQFNAAGYGIYHQPFRSKVPLVPRLSFVRAFLSICRSGYDVVHIHTEGGPPLFAFLAKLAGVRCVAVTPHNTFQFRGLLRLRKRCERHFVRLLGGRYGIISDGIENCEKERFGNTGIRVSNWLDVEHYRPPSQQERAEARTVLGARQDDFLIVSVGNCNEVKNHAAILRSIALLPPAIKPVYLHIGREEQGYPERRLAEKLGILDNVCFLGSQRDVLPFLWAADAFVMPSLHEGLGMAAIEAVAAGVPLVCSRVDGLADVAAVTRHTVLTATTPESVAEGISFVAALAMDEARQRALEDSCRVRANFSVKRGVESIVRSLYAGDESGRSHALQAWRQS